MADVQSNIQVNLDATQALAQLKSLQAQLAQFNNAIATSNKAATRAQANLTSNLINSVNATGKFAASITTIKSSTDAFTDSLERNKFSTREYFRYAGGATRSFGKLFKTEFDTIGKVAEERVKTMQTQYIKMGRDANGAIKAIAVRPLALDMNNLATKTALAAQKQQLLNQLLKQGSTNLLNFGKNTQWAGRQLMVGFTIPLSMLAVSSSKTFMALEKQAIRFKRVYGEMFTTSAETSKALKEVELLAKQFTKYGVSVEKTMQIAADAAATGKMGADLMAQVAEATRLAVLGGVEQEQALETTISLTNAFGIEADKLRGKIDFLNAVENQTVLNIEDLTIAIPKAAPVIRQLGGDVEDLAFFMTAMKEGGINASEGANALKSGLASLINPSKKASAFLADFGVNIKGIVESNKGDIKSTVIQFAQALDTLDPLNRARAIEQLFGKFQFSRLSTLFQNVTKDGTQASRTLSLASNSIEELAILSERELAKVENATGTKFKKTMEDLKVTLAPIGEQFLKAVTPIVEFVGKILEKFNGLSDGVKSGIVKFIGVVGLIGPAMLMTFGLIANGAANIIKLFITLRKGFMNLGGQSKVLGEQTQYMTSEQLQATTVAASLDQAHSRLRQTFLLETQAANQLTAAYQRGIVAANNFARTSPGMMRPGFTPRKFNKGGEVPGSGNTDTVPAMLTPGEFVVNKQAAQENRELLPALNKGGFALRGVGTKMVHGYDTSLPKMRPGSIAYAKAFVAKRKAQQAFLGMPAQNAKKAQERQTKQLELDKIATETYQSPRARNMLVTNPGERVSPSTGRSFPSSSVGGIYKKPNGDMVFVKPMPSEKAALAEMRATEIARDVHGLVSPQQKLTLIADPNDPTGHRRYFALESKVDPRFANVPQEFTKEQTIKQLVASTLRGDKDLAPGNIGGNVIADVGPAGVFSRASGAKTEYAAQMPSMEEQAMINLLGVKGGARKFFAQSTSDIAKQMSPVEYDRLMRKEINEILPKLKTKIGGMNLSPEELPVYEAMIARLEAGSRVDWTKFQPIHAAALNKGGFVERQFGTIPQNVINPFGLPNLGTTGMVAGHFTAQNKKNSYANPADIPLYHKAGTRFENYRVSSGVTTFIPQGYNQFTESYPGIIVEPYPLTYDDAHFTNNKLLSYIDQLNDEYAKAPNPTEATRIANKQLAARIALAELQADAQAILGKGNKSDPRMVYAEAQADKFALTTSMAEGETFEDRKNANSIYARKREVFLTEYLKGNNTVGIARKLARQAKKEHARGYRIAKLDEEIKAATKAKNSDEIIRLEREKQKIVNQGIVLADKDMSGKSGKVTKQTQGKGTHKLRFSKGHNQLMQEERVNRAKTRNVASMRAIAGLMHRSGAYSAGKFVNSITAKWMAKNKLPVPVAKGGYVQRSKGTNGYGEPETVPALLTPGEFIASPALAQQIGPALQYINSGGKIEQRSKGTIVPGTGNKDTVPMMLNKGSFVVNKGSTQENKGFLQRFHKGGFVLREGGTIIDPITGKEVIDLSSLGSYGSDNPDDLDNTNQTPARRKAATERLKASKVGQFASRAKKPTKFGKFAPGIGAAGMGASMALGMTGNMEGSMIAMGLSMAAPLMKTQVGAVVTALVAVGATYYALKKKNEALAVKTMETTQAMGAGSKSLNELAVFANKVTGTELMNRRRADSFSKFQIKPGKTTFGQAYVQTEAGQQKIKDITTSMKATNKADTQDGIASQLATSIASGTLTASQAQSIAAELGKQLNDYSFGISVNAKLINLMGPNGENALKDPIGVRVKLLTAAENKIGGSAALDLANNFNRLQNPFGKGARDAKQAGTAVALQSIAIEQSQELLNSFDAQTQKLIEQLEIKKKFNEADKLRDKREKERLVLVEKDKKINEQTLKFFNDVQTFAPKAATSLLKTSETGAVAAYKGTAEQDIAGGAVEAIKGFKGITEGQQYAINLQLKGKNVSPTEILNLTKLFKDDQKGTEALLKVLVSSPAQTNEASQVASMFIDNAGNPLKEVQKTLVLKMTEGKSDANQDNIDFFKLLGKTGEVLDMKIISNYIEKNPNGTAALKEIFKQVQKTKGKLKIGMLAKIDGMSVNEINALSTQIDYFDKLPADQQKTFTITMLTAYRSYLESPEKLSDYLASTGASPRAIERQLGTAKGRDSAATAAAAAPAKQVTELEQAMAKETAAAKKQDEQKGRDSLLDDMLKKLKLFHDSTIKATGGFKELMNVMTATGKIPIDFDGTINRLRTFGEGKVSEDYLRFVENLTPEQLQDKKLMNQMGIKTKYDKKTKKTKVTGIDKEKQQKFEAGLVSSEVGSNYNNTVSALVEMERRTDAINILRRKGFTEQEANNVVTNDSIALAITQGKISKEDLNNIKTKQKELTKANFEYNRFTKTAQMDAAESQSKQLQMARMYIELQEKMIENEYIKEKTKLNIQKGDNDYALEQISRQEYDINESYDKQITALEEINRLREKENELTSKKMSISEAFASGDMSAAARAMQEYREARISQNARTRMEALEKAKENAIKGVTATGRDGKVYTKEDLEKMNRAIDQRFIDMENEVRVKKIELDKLTQQKTKLTKDQIDAAISTINLAVEALGPEAAKAYLKNIFTVLDGNAETTRLTVVELNKDLDKFLAKMDAARIAAVNVASGHVIPTPPPQPSKNSQDLAKENAANDGTPGVLSGIDREKEYKLAKAFIDLNKTNENLVKLTQEETKRKEQEDRRKQILRSMGIPGFRSGGKINGPGTGTSDSIPALLSDGEYVVNAASVDKYGVNLFESLNAQKLAQGGYLGVKGLNPDGKFKEKSIGQKVVGAAGKATGAVGNFLKEGLQTMATSFIRPVAQGLAPGVEGIVNGITGMGGAKPNFKFGDVNVAGANLYKKEGYGAKDLGLDILGIGLTVAPYGKILKPLLKVPGVAKTISTIAKPVKAVGSKIAEPFKNKTGTQIGSFSPMPKDILKTAIEATPRLNWIQNNKNKSMLANFEAGPTALGKNENNFLDSLVASGSMENGLPLFLSSLTGKRNAKNIIENQTNLYRQKLANAKAEQENIIAKMYSQQGKLLPHVDESQVTVIHSTAHPVVREKNGDIKMYSGGNFYKPPRTSFHNTLEAPVESHLFGQWSPSNTKIVSSMADMKKNNGLPRSVNATDTWWIKSPGEPIIMKNSSAIRSFMDENLYTEELIKRGLIKKGKKVPPLVVDKKTKEVLHISKKDYTAVDRLLIGRMLYPEGIRGTGKSISSSLGRETSDLDYLALQSAKELIGIKTPSQRLGQWSLNDPNADKIIQQLAKQNNVKMGIHQGSIEEMVEKQKFPTPSDYYPIELNRFLALRGKGLDGNFKIGTPDISPSIANPLMRLFQPKNTVYAATRGMKLPVAKKTQNKTAGSNYYLSQGADDDISLYHSILSAGSKGKKGSIKGLADLLHDPFDGSTLQSLGNKGSITESFDLMALALMDAARMSGTTKTGLNTSINAGRTDYSQKLVDTLRAKGLDKIVDIQPRIKPSFVDELGKKTPPGSKVGGQVWLENELRFLNKEDSLFDILKSSTLIPNNVVNIARQSLLDLLKYGFDKKRVDDAVKQYGKGMNIPGYAMGGMVRKPYAEPAPAQKMNMGGMVPKYMAAGGFAKGTDTVPAMLTPGEFIVNKKATQKFGPLLSAINSPTFKNPISATPNFAGINSSNNITSTNNSKTLYNYNLNINVSNSNANPNDIARTVIKQIRSIDDQRIRSL